MNDKTVVLNGSVVNYDGNVDYSNIASEVVVYDETPKEKKSWNVSMGSISSSQKRCLYLETLFVNFPIA